VEHLPIMAKSPPGGRRISAARLFRNTFEYAQEPVSWAPWRETCKSSYCDRCGVTKGATTQHNPSRARIANATSWRIMEKVIPITGVYQIRTVQPPSKPGKLFAITG